MPSGPTIDLQQALNAAVEKHGAGNLAEAEAMYRQVLEAQPDHPDALHLLGVLSDQSGDPVRAEELISKALAARPNFADALSNLGNVLRKLGKPDDAVESYQKALALEPNFPMALNNLGNALKELGRLDDAVASYRKALELEPAFALAVNNLGSALVAMERLEDAADHFGKAIGLDSNYAEAHNNLGSALQKLGRLQDAAASHQRALAIDPNAAEFYCNYSYTLAELGHLQDAANHYHQALNLEPDNAQAWNNLRFVEKALRFAVSGKGQAAESGDDGFNDNARATPGFAIHQLYLAGFRPHEADERFEDVIAALPAMADQAIPIDGADDKAAAAPRLADKVVALLHFGRSGTGLLHSLIDGHPEISTLPSIYLRGYFNEGVWDKISAYGWRQLPDRFADEFAVLFDARTSKPIPGRLGEPSFSIGTNEGMTAVGENRDEFLSLDRDAFRDAALALMQGMETVDPMSFFLIVHGAYEKVLQSATDKHTIFYHIHNPDDFGKPNFLRYAPDARLMMTVREPIQNCESSIRDGFKENNYDKAAQRILGMLFDIDQIAFRKRESIGVRLEDMKDRPEATMGALSAWLGVEEQPSLYEMTAQGKKWWGDPSSPDYGNAKAMSPFDTTSTKRPVGSILSERDRFVLATLFTPFSVRFGYREADPGQFRKDLDEVRPLLDGMLDFDKSMADGSNMDHGLFQQSGAYLLFHAGLVDRWDVLDELGDYPHMLEPLVIA